MSGVTYKDQMNEWLAYLDGLDGTRKISSNGLLTEDMLASLGAFLDLISMELRRGANPDLLYTRWVKSTRPLLDSIREDTRW